MLRQVVGGAPRAGGRPLLRFLDHARAHPAAGALQADYVATFDQRKRCCLYLTYYAHGDTRKRGLALLRLKQTYHAAGLRLTDDELPDHLAVVLEYAAADPRGRCGRCSSSTAPGWNCCAWRCTTPTRRGPTCWTRCRPRCRPLPGDERAAVGRLAAQGPPEEQVGLAPFAPPEYMPQLRDPQGAHR